MPIVVDVGAASLMDMSSAVSLLAANIPGLLCLSVYVRERFAVTSGSTEDNTTEPITGHKGYQQAQQGEIPVATMVTTTAEASAPPSQYDSVTPVQVNSVIPTITASPAPAGSQPQPQLPSVATDPYFTMDNEHSLNRNPMMISICPHCQIESTSTRTKTYPNFITWISVGGFFLAFWPLCWIPLVVDSMKQTDHYCVSCGALVGRVKPYQDCCITTRG